MATGRSVRTKVNILITGTPGTGKSITASEVAERSGLRHIDIGQVAKAENYFDGWDDQFQCYILDEDKVVDDLNDSMDEGGNVVEYHGCDFFPERWFDAVFVLRTDNTILYDRLIQRGYNKEKVCNNIQCEIFQTILEEARDNYDNNTVFELISNLPEDLEKNIDYISQYVKEWKYHK